LVEAHAEEEVNLTPFSTPFSYDGLLRHPQLKPGDHEVFQQNIATLKGLRQSP